MSTTRVMQVFNALTSEFEYVVELWVPPCKKEPHKEYTWDQWHGQWQRQATWADFGHAKQAAKYLSKPHVANEWVSFVDGRQIVHEDIDS